VIYDTVTLISWVRVVLKDASSPNPWRQFWWNGWLKYRCISLYTSVAIWILCLAHNTLIICVRVLNMVVCHY